MLSVTDVLCHSSLARLQAYLDDLVASGLCENHDAAAAACMRAPRLLQSVSRSALFEIGTAADVFGHAADTARLICQRQLGSTRRIVGRLLFARRCGCAWLGLHLLTSSLRNEAPRQRSPHFASRWLSCDTSCTSLHNHFVSPSIISCLRAAARITLETV